MSFLFALLLFLLTPVASVFCGDDEESVGQLCYSGTAFLTGEPESALVGAVAPDGVLDELAEALGNSMGLAVSARVLAFVLVASMIAGLLSGFLGRIRPRVQVMTAAAGTGVLALVASGIVTVVTLGKQTTTFPSLLGNVSDIDPREGVGLSIGFWLTLAILVVIAVAGIARLLGPRLDQDFQDALRQQS
ncbi:hypothetical protein CFN78_14340 [Amycolatopsis antarctica]|uniref:Uncharacterized protein n=1 Tax=Amycolatopsis antarctica TaxID=1854586 RepID=A0A263D3X9_9PSEU|nr:hypothetical protein CFN78_14340 [Amycolatopsis antarctica]